MTTQILIKAIIVLRALPNEPHETTENYRNLLLKACEDHNFQVIEIFYYEVGDHKRRDNIIRFIRILGEKIAVVTNHIPPKNPNKKCNPLFKKLVKEDYIDVYKFNNGELLI